MSTRCRKQRFRPYSRQRGMALITGLLLLVVVTILALSMFRSYGIQQKIAGNGREKQRAVSAAVSAQQYAEWWLSNNSPPAAGTCTGTASLSVGQVCSNIPDGADANTAFTNVPWMISGHPVGVELMDFTNTTLGAMVNKLAPSAGTYYARPMFYVTDLGQAADGPSEIYQVDATGYGGTSDTVAVVESTYSITPAGRSYDK